MSQLPVDSLGKALEVGPNDWAPYHPQGDLEEDPGFWPEPGPALAILELK